MDYQFIVYGHPVPKARARYTAMGRGGFYTPGNTRDAELLVQAALLESVGHPIEVDRSRLWAVACIFYTRGHHRADIDNYLKLVLDACTGLVWADDSKVWELHGTRAVDQANPRTEVKIWRL